MFHKLGWLGTAAAATLALAIACGDKPKNPASPTATASPTVEGAAADGSTLKVAAPAPVSPVGDVRLDNRTPLLIANPAVGIFQNADWSYHFQLFDETGAVVADSGTQGNRSFQITTKLAIDKRYTWWVRAELPAVGGLPSGFGPWSAKVSFLTPKTLESFFRSSGPDRIYDNLTDGRTVGVGHGVTFVPGKGVQLLGKDSFVEYDLGPALEQGEFSFEAENIGNTNEEWKTKILSMLDCCLNVTDNLFRVTVDKRSDWLGQGSLIRFTVRTPNLGAFETKGGPQKWDKKATYFWGWYWGNGVGRVVVMDGAKVKEDLQAPMGRYNPKQHIARLGSVGGRGGNDTLPNVIIRHVWISGNKRPPDLGKNQ
ncbi:MAG: hypothetical protein HYX76_03955 [Acidobacteria bacterium]|nr:hypothetical protein [Acidobacteriota bacterium]